MEKGKIMKTENLVMLLVAFIIMVAICTATLINVVNVNSKVEMAKMGYIECESPENFRITTWKKECKENK